MHTKAKSLSIYNRQKLGNGFALGFAALLLVTLTGCGDKDRQANELVFAGKVINSKTGEWPNNRLVLVFLHGEEIGRAVSSRGAFPQSSLGIIDGLFVIKAPNTYGLTKRVVNQGKPSDRRFDFFDDGWFLFSRSHLYCWIDELDEGGLYRIPIPSKNIEYVVKVVDGDVATLPSELQVAGSARLRDSNTIVVSVKEPESGSRQATPDPSVTVQKVVYYTKTETIELNKFTVPIDNCGGNLPVSQKYIESQTFIHEYHAGAGLRIGVEIPVAVWLSLVAELQAEYGFEDRQLDTRTVEYNMAAEPHSYVKYVVTWSEVWEVGTADIASGDDIISVPFRVRTNIVYQIDSEAIECN